MDTGPYRAWRQNCQERKLGEEEDEEVRRRKQRLNLKAQRRYQLENV